MYLLKSCLVIVGLLLLTQTIHAGEVRIVKAVAIQNAGYWKFDVTLQHHDTGWEHYANEWRIVSEDGKIIGTRTLMHPHVNEQPFTRSLPRVEISEDIQVVFIEARDTVHGWAPQRYKITIR